MKHNLHFRVHLAVLLATLASGCATKQVTATYLLPAREVSDIQSVNVLAIEATTTLTGDQSVAGDAERISALARQMLASQLYRRGFYRIEDAIWGSMDGAAALMQMITLGGSRHGYGSFTTEASPAKATLKLEIDLDYNIEKISQRQTYELTTVPFIINKPKLDGIAGGALSVPVSVPDIANIQVKKVESSWGAWEGSGRGRVHATLTPKGATDPVYAQDFTLKVPALAGLNVPSLLRAAMAALSPIIEEITLDLSPTVETRPLILSEGGDSRAVTLLEAGAFTDAVDLIESIPAEELDVADLENLGVAHELRGDYRAAAEAYERALGKEPENEALREKMLALSKAAKAQKDIRASGAKANDDTSFKAPSSK